MAYLRPHDLRRTLDAGDTPIQAIRAVLRHVTIAVTQIYLGDNPLRANRTMSSFVIPLRAGQTGRAAERSTRTPH